MQKKSRTALRTGRLTSNDYNSTNINKAMNIRLLNDFDVCNIMKNIAHYNFFSFE